VTPSPPGDFEQCTAGEVSPSPENVPGRRVVKPETRGAGGRRPSRTTLAADVAFTHTSWNDYEIVAGNLLEGGQRDVEDRCVRYAVFTDPPLARIGASMQDAVREGADVLVGTMPTWRRFPPSIPRSANSSRHCYNSSNRFRAPRSLHAGIENGVPMMRRLRNAGKKPYRRPAVAQDHGARKSRCANYGHLLALGVLT